jgi:hypothetical protein
MTAQYQQALTAMQQLLADLRNGLDFETAYNRYMQITTKG